jgi:deoxyribodipyrimidine photo-lyase
MDKPRIVIHIFHRDLRLVDNAALYAAHAKSAEAKADLVTLFIFTPEQVTTNPFKSTNSIEFMLNSLDELNTELKNKLSCIYANQLEALHSIQKKYNVIAISEQRDYTPFAKQRATETVMFCAQNNIEYIPAEDLYLTNPGEILNKSHRPFQKFTPFYENAKTHHVPKPKIQSILNRLHKLNVNIKTTLPEMRAQLIKTPNPHLHVKGGRKEALSLLANMPKDYTANHDTPSISTSNLSAHNHFGTVSIREVYHALENPEFRRQLYWRDFYGHITHAFEDLYDVNPYDFQREPQKGWSTDKQLFQKWTDGKTGHKLVDAAMMQLKKTGYIHNRPRLVAAIYLTKHLKIHWRWGEKHFAQHLVDYDFAQNFGNWCWVASVLPFSMAPFRSLDPEIQLKKFDPEEKYVKMYLD